MSTPRYGGQQTREGRKWEKEVVFPNCGCLVAKSCLTLLQPHGLSSAMLLCPLGFFQGKNTGVSCLFLLQGIFPTQGSNSHFLHQQADSLPLSHRGSPVFPTGWGYLPRELLLLSESMIHLFVQHIHIEYPVHAWRCFRLWESWVDKYRVSALSWSLHFYVGRQ